MSNDCCKTFNYVLAKYLGAQQVLSPYYRNVYFNPRQGDPDKDEKLKNILDYFMTILSRLIVSVRESNTKALRMRYKSGEIEGTLKGLHVDTYLQEFAGLLDKAAQPQCH
mmetsp:Transcript_255/g.232  ORF Transcript_255/g.232 Transcript_255/m.232 type:complete len:110 (-) Transcript_255:1826-2155(-)